MNDPLLSLATGYLSGKISTGEVTLQQVEEYCLEERPTQPDGIIHTCPDPGTIDDITRFSEKVAEAYKRNNEGLTPTRLLEMIRIFGSLVAQGKASASSIAKLCGLDEQQLEEIYMDILKKTPQGNIH